MTIFIETVGALVAVMAIAVMFGIPKHYIIYSGLVGAAGWLIYLLCMQQFNQITISMFLATIIVAVISHIFARILKAPVTLFLVSGILPLVPGVGMYRIVYYLITSDIKQAGFYLLQTLKIAGLIALAIFFVDTCFKLKKTPYHFEFKSKK